MKITHAQFRARNRVPPANRAVSRFTFHVSRITQSADHPPAAAQRGVALVITLILLAVITFMAIAFLVISRGERSSVTTQTDQTIASQAANAALERSLAELVAHMTITTNEFNYGVMVPTNFSNPLGFNPSGPFVATPTNVNYGFKVGGATNWTATEWEQNIANLWIDPRPPVFYTNRLRGGLDFRYYLDLNRNGFFEPTGWILETNNFGLPVSTTNFVYVTGDPQWIGGLEFPDRHHGPDNLFTYRYTYFVVPESKTLDVNYIYNDAKAPASPFMSTANDGFLRNEGAGTYEINLASFLVDLNTNFWSPPNVGVNPYTYYWQPGNYLTPNKGVAFEDALSILAYRYGYTTGSLFSVDALYGNRGAWAFRYDYVDGYSAGPPMVGTSWQPPTGDADQFRTSHSWSGSPNSNHVFSISDLFDKTKIHHVPYNPLDPTWTFPDRIAAAGTNISTYNRYTAYRLLSQLGTDSAPEPAGTINLNYDNLDLDPTNGVASVTNFMPWQPSSFLTAAALRLLTNAGYTIGNGGVGSCPTNIIVNSGGKLRFQIQVFPTNLYSSSIHRLLQLAANIYDASQTNRPYPSLTSTPSTNGFPTVFRPYFTNVYNRVYIVGYAALPDDHTQFVNNPPRLRDPYDPLDMAQIRPGPLGDMVAGIPMVVGARKGFPNFNELSMQTDVTLTRKLEFVRAGTAPNAPLRQTNQFILMTITNTLGLDAWNSYRASYPRNLQLLARLDTTASLAPTNDFSISTLARTNNGAAAPFVTHLTNFAYLTIPGQNWSGFNDSYPNRSMITPMTPASNHFSFLLPASLLSGVIRVPYLTNFEDLRVEPALPNWFLRLDTRLYFVLYDSQARRVIDYVNLLSRPAPVYLNQALTTGASALANYTLDSLPGSMWLTNQFTPPTGPTFGVLHQIGLSLWTNTTGYAWTPANNGFPQGWDLYGAVNFFRTNLMQWPPIFDTFQGPLYITNHFFAPYAASRTIHVGTAWQVNDPLVHYTIGDLTVVTTNAYFVDSDTNEPSLTINRFGTISGRYEPWGGYLGGNAATKYNLAVKDPQVEPGGRYGMPYGHSDDWDFPNNKYPNVGWLGRVHRGTPWQTVYLKSPTVDAPTWLNWSGNPQMVTNFGQFPNTFAPYYTTNINFITNYTTMFGIYPTYAFPDGILTFPTNDWALLDIFSTSFNDDSGRGKLNINQTNLAVWSAVLGGVIVTTNDVPGYAVIDPAGVYIPGSPNLPAMVRIVDGINQTRITLITNNGPNTVYLTNQNKVFTHLGDLMAVPQLTTNSPFFDPNKTSLPGVLSIKDSDYERIPQQILGLLKCDHEPRFVIYAYGQALKPAEHSYVVSGPFSGLYTNYQVTAETAIRAVVRVDGAPGKPHAVVESFNVLPPD